MNDSRAIVFDIQRFALHDGPGIRTLVFLKGCPLSCLWCCNPESQMSYPQIGFSERNCIGCNACIEACPSGAVSVDREKRVFDLYLCSACRSLACAEACPAGAIERFGREMTAEEVVSLVRRDELFYRNSGGGVTLSGGEPLTRAPFAEAVLAGCRELGYHTAVETSGFCAWESFERVLAVTDLFLFDIKHTDPEKHRAFTGTDNAPILRNLRRLRERTPQVIARVPVVPGFNDDERSIDAIAGFARSVGIREMHLLPYHRLGRSKYDRLFLPYRADDIPVPSEEKIEALRRRVADRKILVHIGG